MSKDIPFLRYFFISAAIHLSSCYYYPDLRYQTMGSFVGGVGAGLLSASLSSDLILMGGATIGGSFVGGLIGQEFDNLSPLMLEDPINDPAPLFYYQTLRPPFVLSPLFVNEIFTPGQILWPCDPIDNRM